MAAPSQRQALRPTSLVATLALVLSLFLIGGGFYLWAWAIGSRTTQTLLPFTKSSRILLGARLDVGDGYALVLRVNDLGRALVSSPLRISADRYPVVRYQMEKSSRLEARIFWRRAGQAGRLFEQVLPHDGYAVVLAEHPEWTGPIVEVGLTLSPIAGPPDTLSEEARSARVSLALTGLTAWNRLLGLGTEWLAFRDWTGRSINHLEYSALPAVLAGWIALAALLSWGLGRFFNRRALGLTVVAGVAAAWLILEALWVHRLWRQSEQSRAQFTAATPQDRILQGDDYLLAEFSRELETALRRRTRGRVFFVDDVRYFAERAKYLLLPKELVHLRTPHQIESALPHMHPGDALVVGQEDLATVTGMLAQTGISYEKLFENDRRVVFLIER